MSVRRKVRAAQAKEMQQRCVADGSASGAGGEVVKDVRRAGMLPMGHSQDALQGVDKVTALLLTMGKPLADRIIRQFDNREIRLVARCASTLPTVPQQTIDKLIDELNAKLARCNDLAGSPDEAQQLISGVISEDQIAEIMSELNGNASERVWSKLADAADDKLTEFIANERPQVAAVVLSRMDVDKAGAVMEKLNGEQRADLGRRLLAMKPISDGAMRLISERLSQQLFGEVATGREMNKHARLGAILNNLEKSQIAEVLQGLESVDPEDARRVKEHVFSFEEIDGMTPEDRSRLFDEVPAERAVLALKGVTPQLRDLVLQSISPRSRRIVEAELATDVKVPAKSIAGAQRAITALAMGMAEKSIIQLRPHSAQSAAA